MLQAEVCHAADNEAGEILVGKQCWRKRGAKNIHGGAALWVRHQRQIDELADRAISNLAPHALVFLPDLLRRRVRRPLDTGMPQVLETCLNRAVAAAERREQLFLQLRDGSQVDEPPGATG